MADIFFSANIGEEAASLSKVVSGGELSRIALAIKTVSAGREDSAATMIFDEIDAGLGGTTAKVVAECINKVSRAKQVLCVTHLAQIACMAEKTEKDTRTVTGVTRLATDERVTEIARMASGSEIPAAIQNARAMLNEARKLKRSRKI